MVFLLNIEIIDSKSQVELIYEGEVIEKKERFISITPNFMPIDKTNDYDILFIVDEHITKKEFNLYMRIFDGLGLKYNFWNCRRYNGISINEVIEEQQPWINKFQEKVILFPLSNVEMLKKLHPKDIVNHFIQDDKSMDSGMIIIGNLTPNELRRRLLETCCNEIEVTDLTDYFLFRNPTKAMMEAKLKSIYFLKRKINFYRFITQKENERTFKIHFFRRLYF